MVSHAPGSCGGSENNGWGGGPRGPAVFAPRGRGEGVVARGVECDQPRGPAVTAATC